jgi:RHS repeat-associated protein
MRTKIADGTVDTYSWDDRNRLMGIVTKNLDGVVTRTVGYTCDVDDQRVSKTVDGVVENYYLDGNQIAFVTDGGGNETFHYLYGLNVDQVLAQDSATGMLWALTDRSGSVDTLTDADGHVVDERTFDSFGRVLSESNPSVSFRYGYTGRELDLESGLDYYRARYYDAAVGRFISVDPMGFGAGDTNLYRYVGNNSTNATDPTGMWGLPADWNDNLYAADKYIAGIADAATFGATTSIRNSLYGDKVAGQHEGELFTAGQFTGAALMTAVGLGSVRGAGFASSFLGNAAKVGLNGAKFGAATGAGMSVLNDLDRGGWNSDSFSNALSAGTQGAIGGFKFGAQFGAASAFGLLGQAAQLKMLVDGAAGSTMSALDHFQNGEYWSGAGELANALLAAKDAGLHGGRLVADYQSAMSRTSPIDGRLYNVAQVEDPWNSPNSHGNTESSTPGEYSANHSIRPTLLLPAAPSSIRELTARVHNPIQAGNFSNLPTMPSIREILSRLPASATVDGIFKPITGGSQIGTKFKWQVTNADGTTTTYRLRLHDPDPSHPGSNAANGWIYRVFQGQKPFDPTTNTFRPPGVTNENSSNYDANAANNTHIPMQTPTSNIINLM